MKTHKLILASLFAVVLLNSDLIKAEYIHFNPIDSIEITSNCVKAEDITGDGIDEIFVGNDTGFFIFNGATFELMLADSNLAGPVGDIEIGDIEGDSLYDYFVSIHGSNRTIYIYPNGEVANKIEWPGYLNRDPYSLFFYVEDDTSYLNFATLGGNQINLITWNYQYITIPNNLFKYYAYNNYLYDIYFYYGDWDGDCYIRKLSYNYDYIDGAWLFDFWYYELSFLHVFGNFRYSNDYEFFFHFYNHIAGAPIPLNLKMISADLSLILSMPYPELINPGSFKALNLYGDQYDELAIDVFDGNQRKLILLDGNANIVATASVWPDLEYSYTCELDGDQYDEIAAQRDNYLVFYNTEVSTTSIDYNRIVPNSFSLKIYPNPFNSELNIVSNSYEKGNLTIIVYDVLGRKIDCIFEGPVDQGNHIYRWIPSVNNRPSGIYFIRASNNNIDHTVKAVYLK